MSHETYRPLEIFGRSNSYTYQRLFGEFDFLGFDVSHTKDGFQWEDYEEEFLAELRKQLKAGELDLLAQAESYRSKSPKIDERKIIESAVDDLAAVLENNYPNVIDAFSDLPTNDQYIADFIQSDSQEIFNKKVLVKTEQGLWEIEIQALFDDATSSWLEVGADVERVHNPTGETCTGMEVRISFAHPFSRKYIGANAENTELLLLFGCAVAIAAVMGKRSGAKSQYVLDFLNAAMRGSFEVSNLMDRGTN
ncbi:hypothetical protein [Pseudarthrobacter oxydans]|uniref:hypothetical protein n=1 Tax=Pseudarthrobacter oxydans TaxID=1671 RepID=UPI00342C8279